MNIKKWHEINAFLEENGFAIEYTLGSYQHCYYQDGIGAYDGWIQYDPDDDELDVYSSNGESVARLMESKLTVENLRAVLNEFVEKA